LGIQSAQSQIEDQFEVVSLPWKGLYCVTINTCFHEIIKDR
jgi:hypothetical protein